MENDGKWNGLLRPTFRSKRLREVPVATSSTFDGPKPGSELDALAVSAIVLVYLITSTRSRLFGHVNVSFRIANHSPSSLFLRFHTASLDSGPFPLHNSQVKDKDGVQDRHQQQGDECRHGEAPDLRIAQRLPQWSAVQREREKSQNSRVHGDHYRPQTHDACVHQRTFQRLALLVHLLDEIKQDDHMAHDYADETRNTEKCHETKRHPHNKKRKKSAHGSVRDRRENQERLHGMIELQDKGKKNRRNRNSHDNRQIPKTVELFGLFSSDDHRVPRR